VTPDPLNHDPLNHDPLNHDPLNSAAAGDLMRPLMPQPRRSHPAAPGAPEFVACPECAAPASVVTGYGMSCSDGGATGISRVEHVRIWCADGHWFLMPRDMIEVGSRL
jgi:hypothetical protein